MGGPWRVDGLVAIPGWSGTPPVACGTRTPGVHRRCALSGSVPSMQHGPRCTLYPRLDHGWPNSVQRHSLLAMTMCVMRTTMYGSVQHRQSRLVGTVVPTWYIRGVQLRCVHYRSQATIHASGHGPHRPNCTEHVNTVRSVFASQQRTEPYSVREVSVH